ncbi:MAG: M23 family metallopeptidase [Actinomycetales bacterium]
MPAVAALAHVAALVGTALLASAAPIGPTATPVPVSADGAASGPPSRWRYPLDGSPQLVAAFDPPAQRWLPGHRGIDIRGAAGGAVRAVADGVVVFAGRIGDVGVVSVQHPGGLRSTYQPVTEVVVEGGAVHRGEVIGWLQATGSHCSSACLHLGARRGDSYVNPVLFLATAGVRLLPYLGSGP